MITLLMILFVILCIFLAIFILIQPGKGDMGLGSLGGGSQMLFGGSGGKTFFEKATWIMGALFILGALGITKYRTNLTESSQLEGYRAPIQATKKIVDTSAQSEQPTPPSSPEQTPKDK